MEDRVHKGAVGVPWYTAADYCSAVQVMDDRFALPASFDSWLPSANRVVQLLRRQGFEPVKVELDPIAFPAWCREHGLRTDSKGREQYVSRCVTELRLHHPR